MLLSTVAFARTGQSGSRAAVPAKPVYFKDVRPIIQARCVSCHRVGGIAPFKLTTYRDAYAHRAEIARAVRSRIMPPWRAQPGIRKYRYDISLSSTQIGTITRWVAQGAKQGNPKRAGKPLKPVTASPIRVNLRLPASTRFAPRLSATKHDDYRCFVLPWSPERIKFITGFQVKPGVSNQVHHISVYGSLPEAAATVEGWDAADSGPGYDCFGGPTPVAGPSIAYTMMAAWAPGYVGGETMPAGTGLPVLPGMKLIAEIHYNTYDRPKVDTTNVELQLADVVERPALIGGVYNPYWPYGPEYFKIPSGEKDVTFTATVNAAPVFQLFEPSSVNVHMAYLHMHLRASKGVVRVERGDNTRETLLSVPRWDFHWQRFYWLASPVALRPGDGLSVECHYDNTPAHQPVFGGKKQQTRDVLWGVRSEDEMCLAGVYISGRLPATSAPALQRLVRLSAESSGSERAVPIGPS